MICVLFVCCTNEGDSWLDKRRCFSLIDIFLAVSRGHRATVIVSLVGVAQGTLCAQFYLSLNARMMLYDLCRMIMETKLFMYKFVCHSHGRPDSFRRREKRSDEMVNRYPYGY